MRFFNPKASEFIQPNFPAKSEINTSHKYSLFVIKRNAVLNVSVFSDSVVNLLRYLDSLQHLINLG